MLRHALVRCAPVVLGLAITAGLVGVADAQRYYGAGGARVGGHASGGVGFSGSPGFSQNSVHNPFSHNYNALLPGNTGWRGRSFYGGGSFYNGFAFGTGGFYGGYYSPYGYGYGYPYYPAVTVSPLFVPAEVNYGPLAVQRFMGLNAGLAPLGADMAPLAPLAPLPPVAGGFGVLANDPPEEKVRNKPRASTAEAKTRAQRQIELGDASFSRQSFLDATQHYRTAAVTAQDIPEPLFRQGFSLFALGRYDQAAKMFRKALELDPNWPTSGFRLSTLYGDNQLSKGGHLDALAQAVTKGQNSDLLFLMGVVLYADGEPGRAEPFFLRARDLNVGDGAHLAGFLKQIEKQAEQVAAPAGALQNPVAPEQPPIAIDARRPAPLAPPPKAEPARPAKPGSVDL